jgi:hypothetical protein
MTCVFDQNFRNMTKMQEKSQQVSRAMSACLGSEKPSEATTEAKKWKLLQFVLVLNKISVEFLCSEKDELKSEDFVK